uniref:Uncharacterized protein n=1 Tax=Anisakis simplex TaxID=6269 RepID=A0A0M3JI54_ANISI
LMIHQQIHNTKNLRSINSSNKNFTISRPI